MYERTRERIGLSGEACACIDDRGVNCEAAREHGITPIRFETTAQVIRDLDAVLDGRGDGRSAAAG